MATAVVLGGNGLVGAAAARVLLGTGWEVTCTGLSKNRFPLDLRERGGRFVRSNRYDPDDLGRVLHHGADIVVDCVGYTAAHSRLLLSHVGSIGSVVFISSKAVYVDEHGRHSNSAEPPSFPRAVREDQTTMEPSDLGYGSAEGYGANKVAAERVLLDSGALVSVLRP